MKISTKHASQIRLGINWANRDIVNMRLNDQMHGMLTLPVNGMDKVRVQSKLTQKAYHRRFTVLLGAYVHGIFNRFLSTIKPIVGEETAAAIADLNLTPKTPEANQRCATCGHIRAHHGGDRRDGGLGCITHGWYQGRRIQCTCENFFSLDAEPKQR